MHIVYPGQEVMVSVGEAFVKVSYEELLNLVDRRSGDGKGRRYELSDSGHINKRLSLMARAVETGKWTTGRPIDRNSVIVKMANTLLSLSDSEVKALKPRLVNRLLALRKHLTDNGYADVLSVLERSRAVG